MFTFLLFPTYKKERELDRHLPGGTSCLSFYHREPIFILLLIIPVLRKPVDEWKNYELGIAAVALVIVFEAARRASGNLAVLALIFWLITGSVLFCQVC